MATQSVASRKSVFDQVVAFLSARFGLRGSSLRLVANVLHRLELDDAALRALARELRSMSARQKRKAATRSSNDFRASKLSVIVSRVRRELARAARPRSQKHLSRPKKGGWGGGGVETRRTERRLTDSMRRTKWTTPTDVSRKHKVGAVWARARAKKKPADRAKGGNAPAARWRTDGRRSAVKKPATSGAAPPARASRAATARRARAGRTRPARYANVVLFDRRRGRLDPRKSLECGQVVRLRLDIGPLSRASQVRHATRFPDEKLPKNITLDVMVSSTDFNVASDAAKLLRVHRRVVHGSFLLPGDGRAAKTSAGGKYLSLHLAAPTAAPPRAIAHARIGYYFKNILVQSQHLAAHVGEPGGYSITTDFTLSADLTGLEDLPRRPRVSILTNANADGVHQIILRRPGGPATDRGDTIEVKDSNVGATLHDLRRTLAERAPTEKTRTKNLLAEDLRRIAPLGWDLYTQLPGKLPASAFGELADKPEEFVVQIARPNTSSFVLPWAFMYEIPLESGCKPTLCPLVEQWSGRAQLFAGSPRQCPHGPHERNVLCPFGFWGYRYAIEQLASADSPVLTIRAPAACDFVVGETQFQVNLGKLTTHINTLRRMLAQALPQAQLREGKDRATIEQLLGTDLPVVYFYCHGERANAANPNTWLAVGKRETITAQDFIGWTRIWYRKLKKNVWNEIRPLVFINACHSLAIEPETLVSYLDAFVGTGRAAGVIGTEIKVEQTMAMEIAEDFFSLWLSGEQTVESALRAIRVDYLRSGNLFGLVYTPYCWSDLRIATQ